MALEIKYRCCWNRRLVAFLLLMIVCLSSLASEPPGAGDAAHFLRDGLGARGRALGSAFVARADGFAAPFWNPAPMLQTQSTVVGGALEQRNLGLFTFNTLGGQHAADQWGAGLAVVVSELYDVYLASGGVRMGPLSIGAAAKAYQFGVPGDRGSGVGLDVGARYRFEVDAATVAIGIVTRDVGWTPIRWGVFETLAVDRVAWVSRLAVAVAMPLSHGEGTMEADLEVAYRRPPTGDETDYWDEVGEANISLGTSFRWYGITLRGGMQRFDVLSPKARPRPTFGVGIEVGSITVDLAVIPSALGTTYLGGFQVEL